MASEATRTSLSLEIQLRGGFRIDRLERLIELLVPVAALQEPTRLTLDLSGVVFVGPAALATLVASVTSAHAEGLISDGSIYVPPNNRLVARYLDRVEFNKLLTGSHVADDFARHPPSGFRPFQTFDCAEDLDDLARSLTMAGTEALAIDEKDQMAVLLAITEITQNVLDHANSSVGGFAIAQRAVSRQEFEVAVADAGIGIPASLRKNPDYQDVADDGQAISLALSPGVTASPDGGNRGVGLSAIRSFLRENGGTLMVRSGTGAVEDGERQVTRRNLPPIGGTVVALRMKIGRPFQMSLPDDLLDELAKVVADILKKAADTG